MTFTCKPQFAVIPLMLQQLAQVREHFPAVAADQDIRVAVYFKLVQVWDSGRVHCWLLFLLLRMLRSRRRHQTRSLQRRGQTGRKSSRRVVTIIVVVPVFQSLLPTLRSQPSKTQRLSKRANVVAEITTFTS